MSDVAAMRERGLRGARRRWLLGVCLAAIISVTCDPSPASGETLQDAIASAYKYNPQLDAERARLRALDEEVARANSGYRPRISASADAGYRNVETKPTSTSAGETHPRNLQITGQQTLFDGFQTPNAVREAEAGVRAGRETLRLIEQQVLLDTVTSYVDVVRDTAIVRLRENNVNVLSRELNATRDRFRVGEVTRTDVAQAEARRAAAVSALDLAKANLRTSRGNYERTVGRPPVNLSEPRPHTRLIPRSLEEAIGVSRQQNPNVIAALYREQGARSTVDRLWGQFLPTVTVDVTQTEAYDPSVTTDRTSTTAITGRVNVPLYQGGATDAQVRQAKHTHVSRIQEIEQNRAQVQATVVQFWSQLEAAKAQLDSDNAQVTAARTALTGVREEEKVGQRTLLDVLNAEQELLNAEVNLVTTKRNLVVASYSVLNSIGRLEVASLGATNTVYDPEAHYHEVRRKWFGVSITHPDGRHERLNSWQADTKSEDDKKAWAPATKTSSPKPKK